MFPNFGANNIPFSRVGQCFVKMAISTNLRTQIFPRAVKYKYENNSKVVCIINIKKFLCKKILFKI